MNCCFICQSDNPQKTTIQFFNLPPKTKSFFVLSFHMNWIFQHSNTPFFLQIRAFFQNLILKVISEMVVRHIIVSMNFLQIRGYSSTWSDGENYVGEWKDDKKWNGTQTDKKGEITGKWVNGE